MGKLIIGLITLLFVLFGCSGDYILQTSNEYRPPVSEMELTSSTYVNDTYLVGLEMPAGMYYLEVVDDEMEGYYAISRDEAGENIIASDYFNDHTTIIVDDGQYLILMNARTNS